MSSCPACPCCWLHCSSAVPAAAVGHLVFNQSEAAAPVVPTGAQDTVATTGSWQVQPNAVNSGERWLSLPQARAGALQLTSARHAQHLLVLPRPRLWHSTAAVPREALLEVDVRDIDGTRRDAVVAAIREEAARIAQRRKVGRPGLP